MQRAIAARRRLCQAVALAIVLCARLASGETGAAFAAALPEAPALRSDARAVQVTCFSENGGAIAEEFPCGILGSRAEDVIARLGALLGPFPYRTLRLNFARIHARGPKGYYSSAPGAITAGKDVSEFAEDGFYLPDLLPREIARQWLRAAISPSDGAVQWLAEGLPEYLAWRYLREANPEAARVLVAEAMRDSPAAGQDELVLGWHEAEASESDIKTFSNRQRGLLILRTLETVIDRERVDRVLPEVVRRYGRRSFTLADFEKVCEEVAGRNLGWFFRYFFHEGGLPEIELRRVPSESPGVVAGEIVVHGLPAEGSVRVEMAVRTAQGIVEHSVATRGEVTPFTVNVPAPALGVTLDPDQHILRWTEAARRSQAQSQILGALPSKITRQNLADAIAVYRRALAADPEDASLRAQWLHERLGELEFANNDSPAALADLEAAINGHSIAPFETYLTRGKAYLYHGRAARHEHRPQEAQDDARAGLALPPPVLLTLLPREPIESHGGQTLRELLEALLEAGAH